MLGRMRDDQPESAASQLWGDGIVDGGLVSLWSARSWADVSDDELVFLIPNVLHAPTEVSDGFAARIHRIRTSGGRSDALAQSPTRRKDGGLNVFESGAADGVPAAGTARAILGEGWVDRLPGAASSGGSAAFASVVVAELDQFHRDACLSSKQRAPATSAQAMFRSIHSGINAAYVYECFAPLHETLAVGTWTGHLLRGRRALLPPCLAEPLTGLIAGATADLSKAATDVLASLLAMHLGPAALARLRRAADRSLRGGYPVVVDAIPFPAPSQASTEAMLTLIAERSRG